MTSALQKRFVCSIIFLLMLFAVGSRAQSNVYSLNVVGYVNVVLGAGWHLLANPLRTTNDDINNIFPQGPEGASIFLWNPTTQSFGLPSTFASSAWSVHMDLPVGRGFAMHISGTVTQTFVGEVLQGYLTNFIIGGNKLSLLGSKVPQIGAVSTDLAFPVVDGANMHQFPDALQAFTDVSTGLRSYGWFSPSGLAGTGGVTNPIAHAFWVQNPGPDTNWIRYFVVQSGPQQDSFTAANAAKISGMTIQNGAVAFDVSSPAKQSYYVQFSIDGNSWTTQGKGSGKRWTGRYAGGPKGYYRLVSVN